MCWRYQIQKEVEQSYVEGAGDNREGNGALPEL